MPVTRSGLSSYHSESTSPPSLSGAAAPLQEPMCDDFVQPGADAHHQELVFSGAPTAPLDLSLCSLEDTELIKAKDAKALRDATAAAITQVWNEACMQTSALAKRINEGNLSLTQKLNESFNAVGSRLDSIPVVAMLGQESEGARIAPFTGSDNGPHFSVWLRRLEDIIRMRPAILTSEQKANYLIGHLDGVAREKVEELSEEARKEFSLIVEHLKAAFENPQKRYVARQKLSACKQEPGESCSAFANRIMNLVRAATAGMDAQFQKEKALEEFTDRLREDIRFVVKLENYPSFDHAVEKAQMVEQAIAEAGSNNVLSPEKLAAEVKAFERARASGEQDTAQQPKTNSRQPWRSRPTPNANCFNCGGYGHFQSTCSTPPQNQTRHARGTGRPFSSRTSERFRQHENAQLMSCDPVTSSSENNPLQAAQHRISELSLSVSETKAQLDQSQARVEALMKRNDELAQSAFDTKIFASSNPSSVPHVKSLFVCILALSIVAKSSAVWLCPNENPTNLVFVPQSYNCSWLLPNTTKELLSVPLHVYRPNTKRYSSPASYCKIVKHSVTYSVSFFGARAEHHAETFMTVSPEECRVMTQHKRCIYGDMSQHGDSWRTSNSLSFEFPSAPFGCCTEHNLSVYNCYLFMTTVYARYGEQAPESSVGDMRTCRYKDGFCTMSDGSVTIWSPDAEEECRFVSVSKMRGFIMGNVWLSETREFALSWSEQSPVVTDCSRQLTVTDQGYAIAFIRRTPRSGDVGLVTSNQLSAQLLAVEGLMRDTVTSLFRHAIQALCERTNLLAITLHAALRSSPTLAMRALVGREDISATHLGNGFVQIKRCIPVPARSYQLVPFNGTCYKYPRIQLKLQSGSRWQAFLNPSSGVVVSKATVIDCGEVSPVILTANSTFTQYHPLTGQLSAVNSQHIRQVFSSAQLQLISQSPKLTIFHNLILTNFTEVLADHQLQEMWTTKDRETIRDHISHIHAEQPTSPAGSVSLPTFSFPRILPSFSLFDFWVFVCCAVVTLGILKTFLITYLGINFPGLLPLIKSLCDGIQSHPPASAEHPPQPPAYSAAGPSAPMLALKPLNVADIGICKVDIDTRDVWPPRASMVPVNVLTTTLDQPFFVTQIPIQVNGVRLLALVDTGAGITVASKSILTLLGIFKLEASDVPSAVGMAGIPVQFVGCATVDMVIASKVLKHRVHFTATQCVPTRANAYNVILGNDVLRRLPPWSVDYQNKVFNMGQEQVHILTCSPTATEGTPIQAASVHVAETTVLHAGTESLVRGQVQIARVEPVAMVSAAKVVENGTVFVAPAVFSSDNVWLSVTNPSAVTHVLYKGQCLTSADALIETGDGTLYEPLSSATPYVLSASEHKENHLSAQELPGVIDLTQAEVNDEERRQLTDLFIEYQDRISLSSYDLGSYELSPISIKTTTSVPPTRYRPTRIPTRFQKELDEHINKLLRAGRIVESDTPWVHNTVLVKKKDGSLRVCLDFRPLNEVTIPDHYPLPRIEDLLEKVAGNRFYTSLDLASGYMQLLLDPESQEKCGWATHRGIYQFVYLPFGLRNAGAYFSRAMSRILAGLEDNCLAYLDDIIVFNKDFSSHLTSLRKVFERFRAFNIKASGKKLTEVARSRITFLGHEVSGHAYRPAERNIIAIKEMPRPRTVTEVKGFIGMANFFRKFVKGFAALAAPLYELCKGNTKFEWTPEQESAFVAIKEVLTSQPCLAFPRDREFILHTDGSKVAVGAALFQEQDEDKKLAAIGYFSKTLSDSQRKWSPTHIELFAIISALRFFRTTIYGNLTRVFCDHKPLTFLLRHNKTHDNLARWAVELQSYNIRIEYLKGTSNVVADFLSRTVSDSNRFVDGSPEAEDIVEFPVCLVQTPEASLSRIRPYDVLIEQKADPFCNMLMHFLETQTFPANATEDEKFQILKLADHCVIRKNGCVYKIVDNPAHPHKRHEALLIPNKLREPVCIAMHSSPSAGGHCSWKKTLRKIARKFFWPTMKEDVYNYARSCEACQRKRSNPSNRELMIPIHASAVFHKVHLDISGPYHPSARANKYILGLIDHFSKYVIAVAMSDCTAPSVAEVVMNECILKFGAMTELITDNASYLKGELMSELGRLLHINRYFCTPYHHEGNGACERIFATFQAMLRTYISANQEDWDQFLPACVFSYNTSVHTSTNETPFFLMFGRDPIFNIDLMLSHKASGHIPTDADASIYKESLVSALHSAWAAATAFNAKQSAAYKKQYDKSALSPMKIAVGDRVYLRDFAPKIGLSPKLCLPWLGQFRVISVDPPHLTVSSISSPQSPPKKVHMNQVKKCFTLSGPVFTSPWSPLEETRALDQHEAYDAQLTGYDHSVPQVANELPSPQIIHHYNTRFRKRTTSI